MNESTTAAPRPVPGIEGEPLTGDELLARIGGRFEVTSERAHGELTVFVTPDQLVDVITFCAEDAELSCHLLSDLSAVHWPAGDHVVERQSSTTGWPEYRVSREHGVIEVLYVLRSVARNHWLRLSVATSDEDPRLPTVTPLHATADFHEREVHDMFGVVFDGHPDLTRILMPEDWLGHPHRKDYPLGGVDISYKNDKYIPPPDERDLREIVR
jgi:NADH-quinone oxidoreductase subunit C